MGSVRSDTQLWTCLHSPQLPMSFRRIDQDHFGYVLGSWSPWRPLAWLTAVRRCSVWSAVDAIQAFVTEQCEGRNTGAPCTQLGWPEAGRSRRHSPYGVFPMSGKEGTCPISACLLTTACLSQMGHAKFDTLPLVGQQFGTCPQLYLVGRPSEM